ncbi:DNA topoisomerase 3-alpha [Babesia sp. Xinjiang]|uniref:DNA topoisomerase 3-alpha n=1 Tax=Babesia sp. Xinjiang TaxID=462227 RepID=UPI000A2346BE|nr:DNA topoisomerase 3-alpha [Babesia sp. Xinjiang]ORM42199.1 DNA topoisomerase 3-alpha [Babesia sp. Xinjiang]
MADIRVELLDLHSELKCGVFGLCCVATLLLFCYVLCRLAIAPRRMPRSELSVILLSCAQLIFGIIFYFGTQNPFLQVLKKAVKVVQAEIISWSCIHKMLDRKRQRMKRARVMFHLVSFWIVTVLLYSYINVDYDTIYLNSKIGILMSGMWCVMSMTVIYVAHKIRKNLDVTKLRQIDENRSDDATPSNVTDVDQLGADIGDLVECDSETKYQQLLLLVIVEAVTALGTLVWDIVLYYSIKQSMSDKVMELDMPILKEVLYVLSNTILILIPNWTVFYVLYWVQRHSYSNVSSTWDIKLNALKRSRHRSRSRDYESSRRHSSRSRRRERSESRSRTRSYRSRDKSSRPRSEKKYVDPEERARIEHEKRRQREIEEAQREDLTVLVINLYLGADERKIYEVFSEHAGKVRDVQCVRDARSGRSKGVAYVEFYTQESVIKALAMNGFELNGQRIRVQSSQAEKNRAARAAKLIQQQTVEVADSPFTIQVTGLTGSLSSISEVEIKQMFSPFGTIIDVEIMRDPHSNLPLGQAYIKFKRASEAKEAVTAMNGFDIGGQTIKVAYATGANATGRLATHGEVDIERLDEDGGGLISGANTKIALMHKLQRTSTDAPAPQQTTQAPVTPVNTGISSTPTCNITLNNMFSASDPTVSEPNFFDEVEEDVNEECNKYGKVVKVYIDRAAIDGKVWVKFDNLLDSTVAFRNLNGRVFAGNTIKVEYVTDDHWQRMVRHLMEIDFDPQYRNWRRTQVKQLFDAPIHASVSPDCKDVEKNLLCYAKMCGKLVLWLDCDREGEAIAFEVITVCKRVNKNINIRRAIFSAVTRSEIERACGQLRDPNRNLAEAVEARQEIDLRIGSSMTRFMTINYKHRINTEAKVLSYGPCQLPTLGFVVERYRKIETFRPEDFWSIQLYVDNEGDEHLFRWDRVQLFDRLAVLTLYEACLENPKARVTHVINRPTKRYPPLPLDTVEMHKDAAQHLKISSHESMRLAEALYNKGYISYPRTETNVFPASMHLRDLIEMFAGHPLFGSYATRLLQGDDIVPRKGNKNDEAHPPIHPVKPLRRDEADSLQSWQLYEYITRRFLACCSPAALGHESIVFLDVAGEGFHSKGLLVRKRNWLDIYPYSSWTGNSIPAMDEGEEFMPSKILLAQGRTRPPGLLTETNLIDLMNRHGIGTDATMHEHIQKVQDRHYVKKESNFTMIPTNLGKALYRAFKSYGRSQIDLTKPNLRANMERDMCAIAVGEKRKEDVVTSYTQQMKEIFLYIENNIDDFEAAMNELQDRAPDDASPPNSTSVMSFM